MLTFGEKNPPKTGLAGTVTYRTLFDRSINQEKAMNFRELNWNLFADSSY